MFNPKALALLALISPLAHAYNISVDATPGIYFHSLDANGNEVTTYGGAANPKPRPKLKPRSPAVEKVRSLIASAKFYPRDGADSSSATSNDLAERDSTPAGYTTCVEAVLDELDWLSATNGLANWCDEGQHFKSAVSALSSGATSRSGTVAYACAYSGKKEGENQCDHGSATAYFSLVNQVCGQTRGGYYMIEDWGISYGFDSVGVCFCHC